MYKTAIVEDDEWIRGGLRVLIPRADARFEPTECFSSAEDALARFETRPFDLLITDIEMPRVNGLELIERLRKRYPSLLCVIISGYDRFEYAREGLRLGALDYLLKPVDEEELTRILYKTGQLLRERALSEERAAEIAREIETCVLRQPGRLKARLDDLRAKAIASGTPCEDMERVLFTVANRLCPEANNPGEGFWSLFDRVEESLMRAKGQARAPIAVDIMAHINENFAEDLSVGGIAAAFGISPAYLGQVFLRAYHQSINTAVNAARIRQAKALLTREDMPISAISQACGYKTVDHFYRQFRRFENETPALYRARVSSEKAPKKGSE